MPSITVRKGTTGRPLVPGGFSGGRRGWIRDQRSSGMRQIVRRRRFVDMDDLCWDEGVFDCHGELTPKLGFGIGSKSKKNPEIGRRGPTASRPIRGLKRT